MRRLAACTCVLALSLAGCSNGSPVTADPTASVAPESSAIAATEGPNAGETADKVADLLDAYRGTYPGAVVLVRVGDETRVVSGGHAVVGEPGPVTARHRFPVASVTKTMVATAVLQLVQEGKLSLSDSVESWLPGMVPRGDRISVEQLLAHRSGLYNYTDSSRFEWTSSWDPPEILRLATTEAPVHAPDTQSSYSNTNFIVLGLVVERVTGEPLEEVLQERIFAPSGMSDTSLARSRVTDPPRVHGYAGRRDLTQDDLSSAWAAGGVVSSARDLDAFLNGLTSGKLLDTEAFEDMARPRGELRNRGNIEYGLGLGRRHIRCATVVGHGGALPGFLTEAWSSEDGERAVVAMVNDEGSYTVLNGLLTTALCG